MDFQEALDDREHHMAGNNGIYQDIGNASIVACDMA